MAATALMTYLPDSQPWPDAWYKSDVTAQRCPRRNGRGEQCRQLVVNGTTRCRWHGGLRLRALQQKPVPVRIRSMPRFYSRVLSKSLNEVIDAELLAPVDEQLSLLEELSLSRQMVADAAQLWSKYRDELRELTEAKARGITEVTDAIIELARCRYEMACQAQQSILTFVKEMGESAARLHVAGKDKLNVLTLQSVTNQIVRCAHEAFQHDQRAAEEFERLIRTSIRVPGMTAEGTDLTPDMDVTAMDDSIPAAPDNDSAQPPDVSLGNISDDSGNGRPGNNIE